jgi:hypothetical protein
MDVKDNKSRILAMVKAQIHDPQNAFRVLPFLNEPYLQKFVACWPLADISDIPCDDPIPASTEPTAALWDWLWKNVTVKNSPATGMSNTLFYAILEQAKGMFIVYPDRTVNKFAQIYLSNMVLAKMPTQKKEKEKERPDKPKEQ